MLQSSQAGDVHDLGPRQRVRVVAGEQFDVFSDPQRLGNASDLHHGAGPDAVARLARIEPEYSRRSGVEPSEAQK